MTAGVQGNDMDTLKNFLAQLPDDQKKRMQAAIDAVKTPGRPGGAGEEVAAAVSAAVEGDGKAGLSEAEMANIRKAFDAIDTSGNGFIEASEFMNAMEALGTKMNEDECKAVFASFDINADR